MPALKTVFWLNQLRRRSLGGSSTGWLDCDDAEEQTVRKVKKIKDNAEKKVMWLKSFILPSVLSEPFTA